jgi:hypothetical protein
MGKIAKLEIISCARRDHFEKAVGEFLTKHKMVRIDYMLQDNMYYAYIIYEEEVEEDAKSAYHGRYSRRS